MLRILRQAQPHLSLPDMHSKLDWEGRLIGVNLKAFETKRPTPSPLLLTLGTEERRNHGGGGSFLPDH